MNTISNNDKFNAIQASTSANDNNNSSVELFAEELPTQHDLLSLASASSLCTAATFGGTVGTASTFSTAGA